MDRIPTVKVVPLKELPLEEQISTLDLRLWETTARVHDCEFTLGIATDKPNQVALDSRVQNLALQFRRLSRAFFALALGYLLLCLGFAWFAFHFWK
jgi:hypothetical protein